MMDMQTRIRYVRVGLTVLGLWTLMVSFVVIFRAITQLRAWQGDALSDASMVVLLLGILRNRIELTAAILLRSMRGGNSDGPCTRRRPVGGGRSPRSFGHNLPDAN
jgi:hypothetical protein